MFKFLSVSILLSFLWLSPAFADDSADGFLSQTLNMVSSYFSDDEDEEQAKKKEKEKDEHEDEDRGNEDSDREDESDDSADDDSDNADGDTGNIGVMPPVVVAPPAINDFVAPAISIQQPAITIEAVTAETAINLGIVNAIDVVDGIISTINNAPATFPMGVTTVTYTATDAAGNTAIAQQQVTVQDTTPPIITSPAAITVDSTTGQAVAVNIGAATASDAFTPVNITNNAPATFSVGSTTIIWTATDANGNTSTATQTVTVNDASILTNLPPDPGAAGKTTLEGIDSDGDGVRDDVQRWIALTYLNSEKTRAALTQKAKAMQTILLNASDAANARAMALELDKASDCISFIIRQLSTKRGDAYRVKRELEAVYLNTYTRSKAWLQHDAHLSGMLFSVPIDKSATCGFNPAVMSN